MSVTLKDYIEQRLSTLAEEIKSTSHNTHELFESRIQGIEKATNLARATMNDRLDGMNEFRESLRDMTGRLASKDELLSIRKSLTEKVETVECEVDALREWRANQEGKASQSSVMIAIIFSVVGTLCGAAGLAVSAISLVLRLLGY